MKILNSKITFWGFIYLTPCNSVVSVKIFKITHGVRRVLRSYRLHGIVGTFTVLILIAIGGCIEGVKYISPFLEEAKAVYRTN